MDCNGFFGKRVLADPRKALKRRNQRLPRSGQDVGANRQRQGRGASETLAPVHQSGGDPGAGDRPATGGGIRTKHPRRVFWERNPLVFRLREKGNQRETNGMVGETKFGDKTMCVCVCALFGKTAETKNGPIESGSGGGFLRP